MGTDKQTDGRKNFWGSIKKSILTESNKRDATHLHKNKVMYYTHPKVIPWVQTNKQMDVQTNKQTNGQIFTQY
jgi:hypothetical protein